MFNSFSNIDTSCSPNGYPPKYPLLCQEEKIKSINPNKPYEVLNSDGTLKGYFWYYGNSVDLVFDIIGEITLEDNDYYLDISQVINTLEVSATLYNHRHESILYFSNGLDAEYPLKMKLKSLEDSSEKISIEVKIPITKDMSMLKLPRGNYHLDLIVSHPGGYCETLFDVDSCTFEVR